MKQIIELSKPNKKVIKLFSFLSDRYGKEAFYFGLVYTVIYLISNKSFKLINCSSGNIAEFKEVLLTLIKYFIFIWIYRNRQQENF